MGYDGENKMIEKIKRIKKGSIIIMANDFKKQPMKC